MVGKQRVESNQQAQPGLLASILGGTRDAILVTEARSINEPGPKIVYANESFFRMTGYTIEEIVGKTPRILQGPETDRARLDEIRTALTRQEPVRVELLNYRKDGTEFWVEVDIVPVSDENGTHTHWVSVQREVTERRRQQEALKESEERLRTILLQYASDMITILEPNGDIRYQSPAVTDILGYRPEELVGESFYDYVHPEDVGRVMGEFAKFSNTTGAGPSMEIRVRHADGSWRYIEGIGNNLQGDPGVRGMVVNSRDVTGRKEDEKRLEEAEARYRTLVEEVPAMTYMALQRPGEPSVISYVSPQVETVLGYSPEEYAGNSRFWESILHPDDHDRVLAEGVRTGQTGDVFCEEFRMIAGDGRTVWMREDSKLVRVKEDGTEVWHGVMFDITEIKHTEGRLRESEEKYRSVAENIPAIIYLAKLRPGEVASYDVSYMSPRIEEILGYPAQRFIEDQDFWNELVHPDDLAEVVAEDGRTDETGEPFSLEYRMFHRDGRVVWLREEAVLIHSPEGEPLYWQGVMTDVTGRKLQQDALRKSEERYRSVAENIREVIFETDAVGSFTFLTPAWEKITGFTVEEGLGKSYLDFIHPDDLQRNLEDMEQMGEHDGEYTEYEARFQAKDGSPRDIEIKFREHFDGAEDLVSTSGTLNDITDRKETERELQQSEQRFRILFEQSVDAMYVHDEEGCFVDCNSQACWLLGYTREELLSMSVADISCNVLTPEERAQKEEEEGGTLWQRVMDGGPGISSQGHEEDNIRKDGTVFPVEVRVGSVDYGGRRMELASVRDITGRKEAENALVRQNEYLGALNETTVGLMDRLDTEDLLENILGRAGTLLGTDHSFFSLLTPDEQALELRAGTGFFADLVGDRIGTDVGLAGKVFQTAEPVAVDDYSSWPGKRPDVDDPTYAMLGVPLRSGSRVVGVISLAYLQEGCTFGPNEAEVLGRFAELASVALDNARLYSVAQREIAERERAEEEQRRRARELAILHEVRSAISLELDPRGVCRAAVESVAGSYGYALVSTYLVENEELVVQHQVGFHDYQEVLDRIPEGCGVMWQTVHNGEPVLLEDVHAAPDFIASTRGIVSEICVPLFDEGRIIGILNVESKEGTLLDEEDLRLLEEVGERIGVALGRARLYVRAREAEEHFRGAFESASTGMALADLDGNPYRANHALQEMLGYDEEEILEKGSSGLTHPEDLDKTRERDERVLADDGPDTMSLEKRYLCKDGSVVWTISDVSMVRDGAGKPSHFICQFQDITARKKAEEAMRESEERFRGAFENASTGVALVSLDSYYLRVNRALSKMLGYSEEELMSKRTLDLTHPEDQVKSRNRSGQMLEEDGPESISMEKRYVKKDGGVVWAISDVSLIRDVEGNPSHFVTHFQDITRRKSLEQQLSYQALHDSLTDLPNRNSLQRRFEGVVGSSASNFAGNRSASRYLAVLFMDLDGFKEINDSLGHAAGDKLLQTVAVRLKNIVRPEDTVYRLGGDEFCVLLAGVSGTTEAVRVAERIRISLQAPFSITPATGPATSSATNPEDASMAYISTSIGIAVSEPGREEGSLDELLREADAAMYRAKKRGRSLYEIVELT